MAVHVDRECPLAVIISGLSSMRSIGVRRMSATSVAITRHGRCLLRVDPNIHLPFGPVCGHDRVVGDEHDSGAGLGCRFGQEFHGFGLGNRVEPRGGFVGEQDRGSHSEGAGDGNALQLSA